ncbi:hypothetical protein [Salmonella phage ST11_da Silva-2023]|nr:hypothetical protein [Salmonella phage ST11_da Silva-2023]WJJ60571.1 hypothetical protein [Salmonella phage ST10]
MKQQTFTRQEVIDLMKQAWWNGHETSRYCPNLSGSCASDVRDLLTPDYEEENT